MSNVPGKKNSIALTEGPNRAAARAMLRGVGFTKEDLHKPIIGIANTWTEIGPCNYHLRDIAEAVKQGMREAGGTPMEFNTVTISDGITMGTEGMKASLISRDMIADSIELVARGNSFDGLVCIAGCDKNMPGAIMALARLDIPGLMLYGGSIAPGHMHVGADGKTPEPGAKKEIDITIQQVFEAIGAHAAGKITDAQLEEARSHRLPRPRRLRRPVHGEHHGHGRRVPRHLAHPDHRRPRHVGGKARRLARSRQARHGPRPQRPQALADHHARIARRRHRRRLRLRRLDERRAAPHRHCQRARHPAHHGRLRHHQRKDALHLRPLSPAASMSPRDYQDAGGSRAARPAPHRQGLLHGNTPTVTGKTLREEAAAAHETPGQPVIRTWDNAAEGHRRPRHPQRQSRARRLRRQSRRPRARLPPGHRARLRQRRPLLRRRGSRQDQSERRARHPLRRPARRPRHARDARRHRRHQGHPGIVRDRRTA